MKSIENEHGEQAVVGNFDTPIKDSGHRREFQTGAVRDIQEGKGRCDLLPIDVIASLMEDRRSASVVYHIGEFMETGHDCELFKAIVAFQEAAGYEHMSELLLDVSIHYEQGANKYGERNWEKGIPLHCYIDSGLRHFMKWRSGQVDERHDRAFVWNMLGAIWTMKHKPHLIDIPFELIGEYKKDADETHDGYCCGECDLASGAIGESCGASDKAIGLSKDLPLRHPHVEGYFADPKLAGHVGT